ncbi:hypothetical protein SCA6_000957 [Theobroma cacao]
MAEFDPFARVVEWQNLTNLEELSLQLSFLPSNLFQGRGTLTSLKSLSLYGGKVNGNLSINGLLHLKNLEFMSMAVEQTSLGINFLQNFGAMPSLKKIDLSSSGLSGTLPTKSFCQLKHLEYLDISENNLKGNLPECFSNLTSLEILDLSSNQFSGNISCLRNLTSLQEFYLSNNNFEIPSSLRPFFNLSKLKCIYVDNNTIYAETEMHYFPPRFHFNQISLSCCGNGGSFPQFLYHQHHLHLVDLSNIFFRGEFPNWLLENNTNLGILILVNNSLSGPFKLPFPSNLDLLYLHISNNFFNGYIPIESGVQLPSLKNMSKNHFNGSIPSFFGDMCSLQCLDLLKNQFSGGIHEYLIIGCSSLEVLILSNNTLQRQMISAYFNLTSLSLLKLDGNNFSGGIPNILSNSPLSTLDVSSNQLSGRIPMWMGNMQHLEEIVMADNHLQGPIPEEFCILNLHLKFLDLSMISISWTRPPSFNPSRISHVYISNNSLEGSLPITFRESSLLVTLDLSYNHFTINIPNWISKLSKLSYLLLNRNHFEGEIPIQLCKLAHLSLIDLSRNNLFGHIPFCLKITALNYVFVKNLEIHGIKEHDLGLKRIWKSILQ